MKKLLSLALALTLCLGLSAPAAAVGGFDDVFEADYYAGAVLWAVENGITTGTTDTTFSPDETCTTAQILTFLWRSQGEPEPTIQNPFYGLSPDEYYYKAALWAYEKGLLPPRAYTVYLSAPCARSEVVMYLWRLAGCPLVSTFDEVYAPYSISGKDFIFGPLTITFSAASVKKERIPYAGEMWTSLEEIVALQTDHNPWSVTVIKLQPGSTISISDDANQLMVWHGRSSFDYPELSALYEGATTSELYWSGTDVGEFWAGPAENLGSGWLGLLDFPDADGDPHVVRYGGGESAFSDVPSGAPYAEAAAWAVKEGITTGTGGDAFSPDMICTRAQIATFLYRAFAQ